MKTYNKNNLPKHIVKHSPDGFSWGYGGSGPAELARCLLLEVMGKDYDDNWHYQDFKKDYVMNWKDNWQITDKEIREWVKQKNNKKTLTKNDIGRWFTYLSFDGEERGKLKSFDNETQTAFIVYKCNNNWDLDHWKDYTAEATNYSDIKELNE